MTAGSRRLAWVGLAVAAIALLVVSGLDRGGVETDAEKIQRLSESYACPVCNGESVAESNAAVAATIRQFISDQVSAGASELEIRDRLVQTYTVEVLLNPPAEGITTLVWVLPVMFVVLGSVGVAAAITRNQGANRDPSSEDHALLAKARDGRPEGAAPGNSS